MEGCIGIMPVRIFCHGLHEGFSRVEMRYRATAKEVGEFELNHVKPGHPKGTRTAWRMAPHDVEDANPANAKGLTAARTLHARLLVDASTAAAPATATSALTLPRNAVGSKRKQKDNDD